MTDDVKLRVVHDLGLEGQGLASKTADGKKWEDQHILWVDPVNARGKTRRKRTILWLTPATAFYGVRALHGERRR
jgi:hypothetical protein